MRPPGHFPGKKENPGTRKSVRRCETVSFRDAHFLLVDETPQELNLAAASVVPSAFRLLAFGLFDGYSLESI